jgi:hypothetical protein
MDRLGVNAVVALPDWSDDIAEALENSMHVRSKDFIKDSIDGIDSQMPDWWFSNMDAKFYFQSYHGDHKKFDRTRGKQPISRIGGTHLTHQHYGGGN